MRPHLKVLVIAAAMVTARPGTSGSAGPVTANARHS